MPIYNTKPIAEQSRSEIVAGAVFSVVIGGTIITVAMLTAHRHVYFSWIGVVFVSSVVFSALADCVRELRHRRQGP